MSPPAAVRARAVPVALPWRGATGTRLEHGARAALGSLALGGLLCGSVVVGVGGASRRSFLGPGEFGPLRNPLAGEALRAGVQLDHAGLALLLAGMLVCWLVAVGCASALRAAPALGVVVLAQVALTVAGPLLSTDVYDYLGYARLGWVHGLDPYVHPLVQGLTDPVFPYLHWLHTPTVYGPLFTAASLPLGLLAPAAGLWTLKAVGLVAGLATVACVWLAARRLGRPPLAAALFVGLNPVLLVFAVGGAHNDLIVAALGALAILLVARGRPGAGAASVVAAAAVKLTGGLMAPFLVLGAPRRRTLAGLALALAAVVAGSLALFGPAPLRSLSVVQAHQGLSPTSSVVGYLGSMLGAGGLTPWRRRLVEGMAVVAVGVLLLRTWRGRPWIDQAGWAALAVLAGAGYLWPWYLVWALPCAALGRSRALRAAAVLFTALLVVMQAFPPPS